LVKILLLNVSERNAKHFLPLSRNPKKRNDFTQDEVNDHVYSNQNLFNLVVSQNINPSNLTLKFKKL